MRQELRYALTLLDSSCQQPVRRLHGAFRPPADTRLGDDRARPAGASSAARPNASPQVERRAQIASVHQRQPGRPGQRDAMRAQGALKESIDSRRERRGSSVCQPPQSQRGSYVAGPLSASAQSSSSSRRSCRGALVVGGSQPNSASTHRRVQCPRQRCDHVYTASGSARAREPPDGGGRRETKKSPLTLSANGREGIVSPARISRLRSRAR